MSTPEIQSSVEAILSSRSNLPRRGNDGRKASAEGGCGVIGIASSEQIAGSHLLQALIQMRNRGNGKGGGVAIAGLDAEQLGVSQETLDQNYLLTVAYLDPGARTEVETSHIIDPFELHATVEFDPIELESLEKPAPPVVGYFVRVKKSVLERFRSENELHRLSSDALEDEFIYQNSYKLNTTYYASLGEKRAFVLSHGKDLLAFKLVSYGEDVVLAYELQKLHAHVWIGHHRYPTKGRVWHPGGAHPFVGLHEALVHNGDFANYAAVCEYLSQHNVHPLFLTDTEVSALMFDLLDRTFDYPLEYVIEAMAPTTERDFTLLPEEKQAIYQQLQTTHMHGSPDGPWFFLIAQSAAGEETREPALIGITDTSMLRPQVFALQESGNGGPSIGFAASEKQAIDAALLSLSKQDNRFWPRADRYWNARGGSHTDGGAFRFRIKRTGGRPELICTDKFGRVIQASDKSAPYRFDHALFEERVGGKASGLDDKLSAYAALDNLNEAAYEEVIEALHLALGNPNDDNDRTAGLDLLRRLIDQNVDTGSLRRSSLLSIYDQALGAWVDAIRANPTTMYRVHSAGEVIPDPTDPFRMLVIDAVGFEPEGERSLAREIVRLIEHGFEHLVVVNARGHRFIGNGLGAQTEGIQIEVFGSSGDYLASGIDGAEIIVHGNAQDQVAQIMKSGTLVIHGDVGQTFMYGAKGGRAFILGNAAGRPLINAVGKPQVVINGTCLDYLAESFMAGDPLDGGGFVILNGLRPDGHGGWADLETPYPGGNLFSLASGGAIFVRDPHRKVSEEQLNGGTFTDLTSEYWDLIRPLLEENETRFGIGLDRLLTVDGTQQPPQRVYRVIVPEATEALQPEAAWVRHSN